MKRTKRALVMSIVSMFLCIVMLVGTTFAWFTDSVSSGSNRIVAGNLDVDLVMYDQDQGKYVSIGGDDGDIFSQASGGNGVNWEPGKTEVVYLGVRNLGTLAIKYNILLRVTDGGLIGSLEYAIIDGADYTTASGLGITSWEELKAISGVQTGNLAAGISLVAQNGCLDEIVNGVENETDYFVLAVHMKETAGNEYMSKPGAEKYVEIDLTVTASQMTAESDSFDNTYDNDAYDNCLTNGHTYVFNQTTGDYHCSVCEEEFNGPYFAVLDQNLKPTQIYALTSENASDLAAYGVSFSGDRITYTNKGYERTVAFRTTGGELVIDAPNDTVYRYGVVENVYILQVAEHSYYEYGVVGDLVVVDKGHVVINASAKVTDLSTAKDADAANVSFVIDTDAEVTTIAVYASQKDAVKLGLQTVDEAQQDTGVNTDNLVLIPNDKLARIGQELYNTVAEAMAVDTSDDVRIVNDAIANGTSVEDQTLKVSFDVKLEVKDDDKLEIKSTGVLVNCGTIATSGTPGSGNEVGLENNGEIVNNGNIVNKDGQKLENASTIVNYGTISNADGSALNNTKTIINNGTIENSGSYESTEDATIYDNGTTTGIETTKVEQKSAHVHVLTKHDAEGENCQYWTCECGKYFADANATVEITKDSWSHNIVNGVCTGCGKQYNIAVYDANGKQVALTNIKAFRDSVNAGNDYKGMTVKLLSNVALSAYDAANDEFSDNDGDGIKTWVSIGYGNAGGYQSVHSFQGTFDGNGYTISNIYHNCYDCSDIGVSGGGDDPGPFGLFGCVENATIKNLTIDRIWLGTETGNQYYSNGVGAFVGSAIGDCTFTGLTLKNAYLCGYLCPMGGIVGSVCQGNFVFDDINVDVSNVLTPWNWGNWSACDTSIGGIIGTVDQQISTGRKTSHVTISNSSVSAQIMQMNDVMSNYAWYQYRCSGMLIGGFTFNHSDFTWNNPDDISDEELAAALTCDNVTVTYDMWNHQYYCTAGEHIAGKTYSGDHLGRRDGEEHWDGCNGDDCLVFDQLIGGWAGGTWKYEAGQQYKKLNGVTVTYLNDSKPEVE